MKRAQVWTVLALLGVALAAAGCGGDEGGREEPGWIVGLLDRVPDAGSSGELLMVVDLAGAAAAGSVAVPAPGASADEIADYLAGLPRDALVPDLVRDPFPDFDALTRELGIDVALITGAITAGNPPETYQVLAGDFDPAAVDAAVRSDSVWVDLLATAQYEGVLYYAWGDDFEIDLSRVTPVRRLGRGGRLGIDDGFLYWVPWTAGMEGLIDAGAGRAATLADDPAFARVAGALEAAGVYAAMLTAAPLIEYPTPFSGLALGVGGGRDDSGPYWVIVAVHDTAAAADESATAVRLVLTEGTILSTGEPWSERVAAFEVTVEGDMLIAVAHAVAGEGDWMRAFETRDSVLSAAQG